MKNRNINLGEIITITKGKKHISKDNGVNRYINIENLHDPNNSQFTDENGVSVTEDDLIIAWDGANSGKVGVGYFGVIGSTLARLRIMTPEVSSKYLFWFLESKNEYIKSQRTGATIPHINGNSLKNLKVPLPPLSTQKRIAEILDAADALKRKDQELLAKYDELARSIFIDMFGDPVKNEKKWSTSTLKDVTTKIGSGATPTGGKTAYKSSGISLIRSMNVYDFSIKFKDLAYIDEQQALKLKNVEVYPNDVLFNITGASICRCCVVPDNLLPARVNQHVAIIRTKTNVLDPIFLNHLLVSNTVKNKLLGIGLGGGAVMEAITKEQLEQFEIITPPLRIQKMFKDRIENISKQINKLKNKESAILFDSLLQKSFNGTFLE